MVKGDESPASAPCCCMFQCSQVIHLYLSIMPTSWTLYHIFLKKQVSQSLNPLKKIFKQPDFAYSFHASYSLYGPLFVNLCPQLSSRHMDHNIRIYQTSSVSRPCSGTGSRSGSKGITCASFKNLYLDIILIQYLYDLCIDPFRKTFCPFRLFSDPAYRLPVYIFQNDYTVRISR